MGSAWTVFYINVGSPRIPLSVSKFITAYSEFPTKVYIMLTRQFVDGRAVYNVDSVDLVNYSEVQPPGSSPFLLVTTFSEGDTLKVKLMNAASLAVRKRWSIEENIVRNLQRPEDDLDLLRLVHPLMLPDSSLIFSSSTLFRFDNNNTLQWANKSRDFHHSIEMDADSLIWTGSRMKNNKYFNFGLDTIANDAIAAVDSRNGELKFEKSVAEILIENGYMSLLVLGKYDKDVIHLNDIQPMLSSSPYWKKGDLFISLRHRNTILLYRPSTNKVIWLKTGPWMGQHDVDMVDDKTIMIFGNDILWGKRNHLFNGHNDVYFYNFEKDSVYQPYTHVMKENKISTKTQGRCDLLPNGDLLIEETDNGKLYIIDKVGVKMKYVERVDKKHIKMFNWVRPVFN
jgi:hypothetical protein